MLTAGARRDPYVTGLHERNGVKADEIAPERGGSRQKPIYRAKKWVLAPNNTVLRHAGGE